MENEGILSYLIYNERVYPTTQINPLEIVKGSSIYEVIRIIDGVPLYLEEHLTRLRNSAKIINVNLKKTDEDIVKDIYRLIKENNEMNLNVKILFGNFDGTKEDVFLYFIKSFYPPQEMYRQGIHVILYESERKNPNAKTSNRELREAINKKREEKKAFEALLVNHLGNITEGSRTNVFFVDEENIYTPPSEKVLLGVTRTKILELCDAHNIKVIEEDISLNHLHKYKGAFITGTSINVLPIKTINNIEFNSPNIPIIKRLIKIYEGDVLEYIRKKSS